uniref:2Fe-2S ferredoxin-type domain-containing protein n=1 Tax=Ascaris lumbricoides TaxID=6252 RepID=A0A0M3HXT2_ASCLU
MLLRRMLRPLFAYSHTTLKRVLSSKPSDGVKVKFISGEGTHEAIGNIGDTILDVVVNADIPLDGFGACEGTLACCTCHVVLDKQHFDRLAPATEEEVDMLDLAPELTETSRLGCQVVLSEGDKPEISVKIPAMTRDVRLDS